MHMRTATIRNMEVEALVSSSSISRRHGAIEESLASVTYLSDIVPKCKSAGLDIEATALQEVANVLWEQGETDTSIRMRQDLIDHASFESQSADLSLPVLLAKIVRILSDVDETGSNMSRVITSQRLALRIQMQSCKSISSLQFESSGAKNQELGQDRYFMSLLCSVTSNCKALRLLKI